MQTQSKFKICRRLGAGVYEKCQTQKFVVSSASKTAGKAGGKRPKALSDFGTHLVEKQKVRYSYGIRERQFARYVKEAVEKKGTSATDTLYMTLENRVDNVVYRLGLAHTRALARQMVSHGHFTVNGTRVTIPSYQVKIGDVIAVRDGSRERALFTDVAKRLATYATPSWLSFDLDKLAATIKAKPVNTETFLDLNAVLEFYSR